MYFNILINLILLEREIFKIHTIEFISEIKLNSIFSVQ